MLPPRTHSAPARFPPQQRPDRQRVQSRLSLLRDWRQASAATAIVVAALLPFAVAWHASELIAIATALIVAVTLAVGCHVARERHLTTFAIFPEFARLPELAGKRSRLVSARNRRALAGGLRRAASPSQPPRRFDCCPVLRDRIAGVRPELLKIADDLEHSNDPDPASVALIHELLTNGCSPLYNRHVPVDTLHATLTRVSTGIAAPPHA
jgi:hypothetical protein